MHDALPKTYPGATASPCELFDLAQSYREAALHLRPLTGRGNSVTSAPMRLCGFHAIELFLAAYLREKGMSAERIRGFRHDTAQMAAEAQQRGLRLKQKVEVRLQKVRENREYLVSRYEPQHPKVLECNALFATLDELNKKVGAAVNAKRAPEGALQVVQ